MRLYIAAFEPSGDMIGAEFIDEIRQLIPDVEIVGIGGVMMAERGVESSFDIGGLAVFGVTEIIPAIGRGWRCIQSVVADIEACQPDAVILIDCWVLTSWIARRLQRIGSRARRIKLIGPQIWATRPRRAQVLAELVEHVFCIYEEEQKLYRPHGLDATIIGHPAVGRLQKGDGDRFRARYGLDKDTLLIGVLFGSRRSEFKRVAPIIEKILYRLCKADSRCKMVSFIAPSIAPKVRKRAEHWRFPALLIDSEADKADALAAMDVAVTCLGTIIFEVVEQETPVISVYRIGWFSGWVARFFVRTKYITLLNVVADAKIIPEFSQGGFRVRPVLAAVKHLLSDREAAARQVENQSKALSEMKMGDRLPMRIAAEKTLELLGSLR